DPGVAGRFGVALVRRSRRGPAPLLGDPRSAGRRVSPDQRNQIVRDAIRQLHVLGVAGVSDERDNRRARNTLGDDAGVVRVVGGVDFTASSLAAFVVGTYSLTVNASTSLTFKGVAGGGGGQSGGGYGGGGGATTTGTVVQLVPGKTYTLVVGAGGAGGHSSI